ncbi:unnamed protein product [Alopecurus aequalis]
MACTLPYSAPAQPSSPASELCRRPCSSLSPAAKPFQPRILVQWQPPRLGWFKLNFDGSVRYDGSGRASMGGVIRDHSGRVLAAFAEPTEHWSVGVVEARALIRGLRLALDCFIGRLVVEGDDQVLVKLLRGEDSQTRIPAAIHDEILMLLRRFSGCEVQHIYREGNQVADSLCHQAYHTPGEWRAGGNGIMLPLAVVEKVEDEAHGAVYERIRKAKE